MLEILTSNYAQNLQDAMRNMMILGTHMNNYSNQDLHLAATRAALRVTMAHIQALPDPDARRVLEELAKLTDHIISEKK